MTRIYANLEGESAAQLMARAYELAYEEGWTDGLPVIPAIDPKHHPPALRGRVVGQAGI